jgi:hypothetical protein
MHALQLLRAFVRASGRVFRPGALYRKDGPVAISTIGQHEFVRRAKCDACGSTGPGANSIDGAAFLAVICGWNATTGHCVACDNMRKNQKPKTSKPKGKKS